MAHGYNSADSVRQQYTSYEHDDESNLDFAQARYYNSNHGRFTSVDPLTASASIKNPQTFNRYSYVLNSPYKFTDPLGLLSTNTAACGTSCINTGSHVDGSAFRGKEKPVDISKPLTTATEPPSTSQNKNDIKGGTLEQRNAVQTAIDTVRSQSEIANTGFGIFEGKDARYTLEIEIISDKQFASDFPNAPDKALAVTTNNGGGNSLDENAGENVKISIKESSIDIKQENEDRRAGRETTLEATMAHELGHAVDIANNFNAWNTRHMADKKLPYKERRNEKFADRTLKIISLERKFGKWLDNSPEFKIKSDLRF